MQRIQKAIVTTKATLGDYWGNTVAQRLPSGAGSVVIGYETPEALETALIAAVWEPYAHPALMAGTTAFKAPIAGRLGLVDLSTLPADTAVTLDDRKNTGTVSGTVKGVHGDEVDFTVLIVGDEDGHEVVYTFHPGEPVAPSKVVASAGLHGSTVTAAQAIAMGLGMAKIVS